MREAELAGSRKHAATAAQLWLDFQDATRRAMQYRERAETLAAVHRAEMISVAATVKAAGIKAN